MLLKGEHQLIVKGIALEGMAILAEDFPDVALRSGLTREDLQTAQELMHEVSIIPEASVLTPL